VTQSARPPEGSVLDRRTLNRTLLARQRLLERVDTPAAELVERLVGLQAQVPRDPYVSLWSRIRGFDPAELEAMLLERRAVRMTLMRTTLHLVTARDAWRLRAVVQPVCERGFRGSPFARRLDGVDLEAVLAAGVEVLETRPSTVADLGHRLADRWPDADAEAMAYAVRYLVPVVQVTPRGLLRASAAPRLTTLRSWLGGDGMAPEAGERSIDAPAGPDETDAVVLRYLRAFGPATAADVRTWSWLTDVRASIDRLRPRLRTYRDERGRELLDVEDGEFASPDDPAPVRFTGEYDNVFLAHEDRTRITGDLAWGTSFGRLGAFFVDGYLAGAWRLAAARHGTKGAGTTAAATGAVPRLELDARRALSPAERRAVEAEAEELARFLGANASATSSGR